MLDEIFAEHRARLRAVAVRILGGDADADDVLQEAWVRADRAATPDGSQEIANVPGWLTTIVVRVALNTVRARGSRRETDLDATPDPVDLAAGPEDEAVLAESVDAALSAVLDTLGPAERTAFVLHDLFALSFDEIALLTGRSAVATRQAASRGRRRLDGAEAVPSGRHAPVVAAFRTASREGDLGALIELLDPDALMRSDATATAMGSPNLISGRRAVAEFFNGKARAALPRSIDGSAGLVWMLRGEVQVLFEFTVLDGRVVAIDLIADPDVLTDVRLDAPRARDRLT